MKDKFEMLNDVIIDFNQYEHCELNNLEGQKMKDRVKKSLKSRRRNNKKKSIAVAASIMAFLTVGIITNPNVFANVPIIGSAIEEYVNSNGKSLEDYKTVVGQTVTDKDATIQLNEVLLDDDNIVISSTLKSDKVNLDKVIVPFPDIYINGEIISEGGSESSKKINDSTYMFFSRINIKAMNLHGDFNMKIVYENRNMALTKPTKMLKGKWVFEFTTSKDKLMAEVKTIPINKDFTLENGQEINVEDLRITPASTRINYKMLNGKEYDVLFIVEDQEGNKLKLNSGHTLIENSYIRFDALDKDITKLKITPYVISGKEGKEKTDYYKVLEEEAFEINIK
ncbi:MAG: DUF4179 domain-containing protein [Clostridiaceae bacterium]